MKALILILILLNISHFSPLFVSSEPLYFTGSFSQDSLTVPTSNRTDVTGEVYLELSHNNETNTYKYLVTMFFHHFKYGEKDFPDYFLKGLASEKQDGNDFTDFLVFDIFYYQTADHTQKQVNLTHTFNDTSTSFKNISMVYNQLLANSTSNGGLYIEMIQKNEENPIMRAQLQSSEKPPDFSPFPTPKPEEKQEDNSSNKLSNNYVIVLLVSVLSLLIHLI
ncbi:hypothetical protein CYY_005050 [Polysphondylium violaceum]|uniref:Uncharacterized protein n=1 Tax=Polysphondylium violaceum TaxID=133409 RepID=A0A8J4Q466_9MYCE|nr:hypothetical protein CYY_005050 [Polysphondylium violaceum]